MWGLQALLTTRKGKKRFAMYDLTVTLTWQGLWVEDDKKQVCNVSTLSITNELPPLHNARSFQVEHIAYFAKVMSHPRCAKV